MKKFTLCLLFFMILGLLVGCSSTEQPDVNEPTPMEQTQSTSSNGAGEMPPSATH